MIARCSLLRPSLLAQALCLSLCVLCGHAAAQQTQATTPAKGEMATLDKVTVAATRYNATDMQMAATNTVNVLSADDLKTTAVHNVAEALGLMPGVNVINTGQSYFGGIDGAARGEGMFSSVRGLNAEYNVNLINGINVAQGMPYSRGVQLSLLPPSGLQTIALNKTSTADMDGDAIGGTIDYRTPSAFDSTDRQGGSVTLSGRLESRARDYGDSGLGSGAAAIGMRVSAMRGSSAWRSVRITMSAISSTAKWPLPRPHATMARGNSVVPMPAASWRPAPTRRTCCRAPA